MRADLPTLLPLICPACRRITERGRELFSLSLTYVSRSRALGGVDEMEEIEEGILTCDNPACRRRYPILDGIPVILADLGGTLAGQLGSLALPLLPETAALLAEPGPDDAPLAQLLEHLSIYLDAHWGDVAEPPPASVPTGPTGSGSDGFGGRALFQALGERAAAPVDCAVELGCSVGRGLAELGRGARLVIGVDRHLGSLRQARRLLLGETVPYARRFVGRSYRPASISAAPLIPPAATFGLLCGDALDPPLAPYQAQRVAALNLLDAVRSPAGLLSVIDGLCQPGGEVIIASPYAFRSGIVDEDERLGTGDDPAVELRTRLTGGMGLGACYSVEDERELPWHLRRDARSGHGYIVHWLRARQIPATSG